MPVIAGVLMSLLLAQVSDTPSVLRAAATSRVDVVMIGDSNQLYGGVGYDDGWARSLSQRFGLYGTGLHFLGENEGLGSQVGHACNTLANASAGVYSYGASPDGPDPMNPAGADIRPCSALLLLGGATTVGAGIAIDAAGPYFQVGDTLEFTLKYRSLGPGFGISPLVRLAEWPYTNYVRLPLSTHVPAPRDAIVLCTPPDSGPLQFTLGNETVGPYITYYACMTNTNRAAGVAVSTLYGNGSRSSRDAAGTFAWLSDNFLTEYFASVRRRQGGASPRVVIRIALGLNDPLEEAPSIRTGAAGGTPESYVDNIGYLIERLRGIFRLNGWDETLVEFVVTLPHPLAEPNLPILSSFEAASMQFLEEPGVKLVHLSSLISATEMFERGYYDDVVNPVHLTDAGYQRLSGLELDHLLSLPCIADVNFDGGVDGDDIIMFFSAWDVGEASADVNNDGGVDADDLIVFFGRWDVGC